MKLNTNHGPLKQSYMDKMEYTIKKALECHPRTLAIRVDLRLPDDDIQALTDSSVITRFFESLKAKIEADQNKKRKQGKRIHSCTLRYIWVREFTLGGKKHYHIVILLNKDAYAFLGDYKKQEGNLASMIAQAWCSALGVPYPAFQPLTYFPENPCYYLYHHEAYPNDNLGKAVYRISYLAKLKSKSNADGERCFGSSQSRTISN